MTPLEEAKAQLYAMRSKYRMWKFSVTAFFLFSIGISAGAAIQMIHQDSLGLEGYITYLRENWIPLSPWVGVAALVFTLLVATAIFFDLRIQFRKERIRILSDLEDV